MATDVSVTRNVVVGSMEYPAQFTPTVTDDKLSMHFDNDCIIDDMIVNLTGSASLSYKVQLVYPSGTTMEITPSAQSANWSMNQDSDSRNLWYRIPKWATIEVKVTALTTSDIVKVSVIARG